MAGNTQNNEMVAQGGIITLDYYLYSYSGGPLVDADSLPTYIIYDPNGTNVASGTSTRTSLGTYTVNYTVDSSATISDSWQIAWNVIYSGAVVDNTTETFSVVAPGHSAFGAEIEISDLDLMLIKSVLAYPSTQNLILTDDQIKILCVRPALREYFTKFPIKVAYTVGVSQEQEVAFAFPDQYTYGVTDVRVVDKNFVSGGTSSLMDIIKFQMSGSLVNTAGTYNKRGYNPNFMIQQNLMKRRVLASLQNNFDVFNYWINPDTRELNVFSSSSGKIFISWAKYSNSFEKAVKYNHKEKVIKLCQANLLDHLANTAGLITDANLDVTINADALKNTAKELREDVYKVWDEYPDVVIMRLA